MSVVGARPQFIKCKPVSLELRKYFKEFIVHTGQHYDYAMSQLFFHELNIPIPDFNLGVGSGSHAYQTAEMLVGLEKIFHKIKPDCVLVYGDTNSTLAGALAAAKLNIPVAHIEAGLRSFNRNMPEEINRILTDHMSTYLFCPTPTAYKNIQKEGIEKFSFYSGDVMYDALLMNIKIAENRTNILSRLNLVKKKYLLVTIHRAENTDNLDNLKNIFSGLNQLKMRTIVPLHPRTKKIIEDSNKRFQINSHINIINPVGYLDFIVLQKNASKILTDSGGIQKEAYFLKVPCITLRNETEWLETLDMNVNVLVGCHPDKIVDAVKNFNPVFQDSTLFGDGEASNFIANQLKQYL